MDGDDEVEAGEDGREAGDEDAERGGDDVGIGELGAEWRVEGPAGIDAAGEDGVDHQQSAGDVEIPAEQVDAREGEIPGADHDRDQEVAKDGGDGGDQEEEDHHHAVHGEEFVVGVGLDEIAGRGEELEADEEREDAADEEEERNAEQIQHRDALVVTRQEPRLEAVTGVQVALAFAQISLVQPLPCFHL